MADMLIITPINKMFLFIFLSDLLPGCRGGGGKSNKDYINLQINERSRSSIHLNNIHILRDPI